MIKLNNVVGNMSKFFLVMLLAVTVAACANKKGAEDDIAEGVADVEGVVTDAADDADADVEAMKNDAKNSLDGASDDMKASRAALSEKIKQRIFLFGFDQFAVNGDDKDTLEAHGKYLSINPLARIRVQGYTDERGTREYNIALGERRAKAVERLLKSKGAKSKQIEVISYGEESPRAQGSTEEAYSQNRRVEVEYTNK